MICIKAVNKEPFDLTCFRSKVAVELPSIKYGWPSTKCRACLPFVVTMPGLCDRRSDFRQAFIRLRTKLEELSNGNYILEPMRQVRSSGEIIGYTVFVGSESIRSALLEWIYSL